MALQEQVRARWTQPDTYGIYGGKVLATDSSEAVKLGKIRLEVYPLVGSF
jgi:hypothetical protein